MYELNIPDDERGDVLSEHQRVTPAREGKCPACNQKIADSAVICVKCGFNLAEGTRLETAVKVEPKESDEKASKPIELSASDEVVKKAERAALAQGRKSGGGLAGSEVQRAGADAEHRMKEVIIPWVSTGVMLVLLVALTPVSVNIGEVLDMFSLNLQWDVSELVGWGYVFGMKMISIVLMNIALWIGLIVMNFLMGTGIGAIKSAVIKVFGLAVGVILMSTVYSSVIYLLTGGITIPTSAGFFVHLALVLSLFYVLSYQYFEMEGREPLMFFLLSVGIPMIGITIIGYFIALQ